MCIGEASEVSGMRDFLLYLDHCSNIVEVMGAAAHCVILANVIFLVDMYKNACRKTVNK